MPHNVQTATPASAFSTEFGTSPEISTDPVWIDRYCTLKMSIRGLELAEARESDAKHNMS
jgi:hypothetical protein